jgi:hypothetical protein
MKNKTKTQIMWVILFALTVAVAYMWYNPKVVKINMPIQRPLPMLPRPPVLMPTREPEFRSPPLKQYKPGHTQQMGILTNETGETLPLYGKEVHGRRDRYHYYTTTGGDNLYSIPLSHNSRDCMDDIGCQELYGNEAVSVTGKTDPFTVNMYRTDNFF